MSNVRTWCTTVTCTCMHIHTHTQKYAYDTVQIRASQTSDVHVFDLHTCPAIGAHVQSALDRLERIIVFNCEKWADILLREHNVRMHACDAMRMLKRTLYPLRNA